MRQYFSENANQILDGLLFGLGILAVYLGAVATGAIIRSLGGAGSKGLTVLGRYATGWLDYVRGDDRNTINVTLNMVVDGFARSVLQTEFRAKALVSMGPETPTSAQAPIKDLPRGLNRP